MLLCTVFRQVCTGDHRPTSAWTPGTPVKGNVNLTPGTAIATFPGGKYSGHAAIYMGQDEKGIHVQDQWNAHPVAPRVIRWDGQGLSNNGDSFYEIK